ncbi:MAG: hypothetical protein Q7J54_02440 [Candidatus Woesearchaeota archaeon]|nr:hypothetical protein [Candidatus Woesearchaeota archaeon]
MRLKIRTMCRCGNEIKLYTSIGCEKFDEKGRKMLFDFCKKGQKRLRKEVKK